MADTERIPLQHEAGWVDVKKRWTYGDKRAILDAPSFEPAMLHRCVVAWSKDGPVTPEGLDQLDDKDVDTIIDRITAHRQVQLGKLDDPNSSRASSQTSAEERSGPKTETGSSESGSA